MSPIRQELRRSSAVLAHLAEPRISGGSGELSQGLSAISASISNCGVGQIAHVLDGAAIAVKFAKLSASVDKIDSVIMGASELRDDIEDIASASASDDADALATALSSFLATGAKSLATVVIGRMRWLVAFVSFRRWQVTSSRKMPCYWPLAHSRRARLCSTTANTTKASNKWRLTDGLATALSNHECGVPKIGSLVGKLSPKPENAVVRISKSALLR